MTALIVFGFPLLLFVGVAWALTGGRRPSTAPTLPDEPVAYVPPAPREPISREEIIRGVAWAASFGVMMIAVVWGMSKLPERTIWTYGAMSLSLRQAAAVGLFVALLAAAGLNARGERWPWWRWANLGGLLALGLANLWRSL